MNYNHNFVGNFCNNTIMTYLQGSLLIDNSCNASPNNAMFNHAISPVNDPVKKSFENIVEKV